MINAGDSAADKASVNAFNKFYVLIWLACIWRMFECACACWHVCVCVFS